MPDSTITLVIFFFVSLVLSLRAQFAVENKPINQLHGSGSREEAEREISFFFPKQQTVAVIKPDAMEEHKGLFMFISNDTEMLDITFVLTYFSYIFAPHSDRGYFGGDSWPRFLCNKAKGDRAVKGDGWGVLQRAQREAFL